MSAPNTKSLHLGRKVQRIREMRGIKQEVLAVKLGLSQQSVSNLEQSDNIDDERLQKIAEILGVTIEEIKNFTDEAIFTNYVYGEKNTLSQVYSQPISEIHVYNQINPIEKVVELYERMLKERDEIIEMYKKQLNG